MLVADAGIPMIAAVWPVGCLMFLPVVLIESFVAIKSLGLGFRRSIVVTAAANAVSTLAGIPLTWIALVVVQIVTGGGTFRPINAPFQRFLAVFSSAAWLPPYEYDLCWMIPLAAILLCIPFYFVSVLIENAVVCRMVANPRVEVRRFSWIANFASYALIVAFWEAMLAWG
jgi:hypothetical protein